MYKLSFYHTQEAVNHSSRLVNTREGIMKKSEIVKTYVLYTVVGIITGFASGLINILLNRELFSSFEQKAGVMLFTVIFFTVSLLFLAFTSVKKKKTQMNEMGKLILNTGFDQKTPKTAEFFEDKLVMTSPYRKYTEYYDEIRYIISDNMNFTVVCQSNTFFICIPKDRQNPDILFSIDNLLREKLGSRFVYEMGGAPIA